MSKAQTQGPKNAYFLAGHIIARHMYILLLIPLVFIIYPLTAPGFLVAVDFPTIDSQNYPSDRLWSWREKGSSAGLEELSRFPILGLWHILVFVGLDAALLTKLNIVLGFFVASFSFYFSFWLLFKDKFLVIGNKSEIALKCAAIIGALFYAYNPWSFERVVHWHLWMGYALLPLFLVSIIFAFRDLKSWKYILTSIFLWSFASMTPHMTVFYGIIFVCTFFAFLINRLLVRKKSNKNTKHLLMRLSINFLTIVFLFSLVNLYWIYPYLVSSQIRSVSPNYVLVEENLEHLSKHNDLLSTLTLIAHWQWTQETLPSSWQQSDKSFQDSVVYSFWLSFSMVIPVFAFSALLFTRRVIKFSIIFAVSALVGIFLAMGAQSPFDYFKLMLASPILTNYLWLFRDSDKWSFLIAFGYSFLIGITSYSILQFFDRLKHCNAKIFISSFFLFLLIGSIFLYSYPVYRSNMNGKFDPLVLPSDFDKLNTYLSRLSTDKVYFMPYPLQETQWNKWNHVGHIYQMHSNKPSIESTGFTGMGENGLRGKNYYNYFEKSITENRSKYIGNSIYPLGTSYIIFHNDTWDRQGTSFDSSKAQLLRQIHTMDELKNVYNTGFYHVYKIDNDKDPQQFNIFKLNIASLGGLKTQSSLNEMQSFSSLISSFLFADDISTDETNEFVKNSDYIILEESPSFSDLFFSFIDEKYIVRPSEATNRFEPNEVWSKSGAIDPVHGEFHFQLDDLGIQNWEFDYGKGLVITQAMGTKLLIPVEIPESGKYDIFLRYLKNQKGGPVKVYFDNKLIHEINSKDYERSSNGFVGENIGTSLNFTKGKHTIMLENVAGFNTVNMVAVIPTKETSKLLYNTSLIADRAKNIYLLEAESDFYNGKGRTNHSSSSIYPLFEHEGKDNFSKILTGHFRVPLDADLMSLQFISNGYSPTNSSDNKNAYYSIGNLQIYPANKKYNILNLDFEREQASIPLATLRNCEVRPCKTLNNSDEKILSTSLESGSSNAFLRVNVKQDNATDWKIIYSDFIPVSDKKYYNFSLDVSAKDVKQLHTKIHYYDSDKKRINSDFISEGRDGVFTETLTASIVPPLGAKYANYEILVIPNTAKASSYSLDNLKFEEIIPQVPLFDNNFARFQNAVSTNPSSAFEQRANNEYLIPSMEIVYDESDNRNDTGFIKVELSPREGVFNNKSANISINQSDNNQPSIPSTSTTGYNMMETRPIPVKEGVSYNYTIGVEGHNLGYLVALASFRNSSDVAENSTKYGVNASNGNVLSLSPGSEIYTDFDILKASNYTIALRSNTSKCDPDSLLRVSIAKQNPNNTGSKIINTTNIFLGDHDSARTGDDYGDCSISKNNANEPQLSWVYSNNTTYLEEGKYEIAIHSASHADLDSVAIYSTAYDPSRAGSGDSGGQGEALENLFNPKDDIVPASIEDYKKIDPTKYEVKIKNATRPYVMSLAESYDPLWVAYVDADSDSTSASDDDNNNFKKRSIPLFSIVNGFYINKTGDYTLTVEYEQQKWLFEGGIISICTVIAIIGYFALSNRRKIALYYRRKNRDT